MNVKYRIQSTFFLFERKRLFELITTFFFTFNFFSCTAVYYDLFLLKLLNFKIVHDQQLKSIAAALLV